MVTTPTPLDLVSTHGGELASHTSRSLIPTFGGMELIVLVILLIAVVFLGRVFLAMAIRLLILLAVIFLLSMIFGIGVGLEAIFDLGGL
ncbi:MAG: hypothetical protein ABEI52_06665 [Halobacteriaceae archaeon]